MLLIKDVRMRSLMDRIADATKAQAIPDAIAYIEGFLNSGRWHSVLGYQRPNEVHYRYTQPARAAWKSMSSTVSTPLEK